MKNYRAVSLKYLLALAAVVAAAAAAQGCGGAGPSSPPSVTQPSPAPSPTPKAQTEQIVEDPLDVPFVPTPTAVVDRMLEIAKVNRNDLLYDLGSGDGRIVITAARKYGARGVGYDLNPLRIKESTDNAREAGVANLVRFAQQDLFEADLSGATVVTLYLLPDVNLKLRPKLLRDLRPGTRVVSHNYGMDDWEPKQVVEMEVEGTKHFIYYWIVPKGGKIGK